MSSQPRRRRLEVEHIGDVTVVNFVDRKILDEQNIQIIGDLPFYMHYDSADVWANRDFFSLDKNGSLKTVAGVPPDYFSDNGQLWGTPVYHWQALKRTGYLWWISRIKKNLEWFDLLRLDHFRAFSAYWEIPASHQTAKNGNGCLAPASVCSSGTRESWTECHGE